MSSFKYDAFVSYSSLDRPWAKQLADELTARNFKVFYDRSSLDVGDPWEEQLDDSLDVSRHLIVLWSQNANASEYVKYERNYFHMKAREARSETASPARREIIVLLEDPPPTIRNTVQMIPTLREGGDYANGFANRDLGRWEEVLIQIDKTIRDKSNALRILVAVLATSRKFLEDLDFDRQFRYIGSVNEVITKMGIGSMEELLKHYGETLDNWRPFGSPEAEVWTVLDRLKQMVAKATDNRIQIEWEPIGKELWSTTDQSAAELQAARLAKELSLIVIDPISLVDDNVRDAVEMIRGSFSNAQSAVMVLTPFKMLEPSASLRNMIQSRAMSLSSLFYQPPVPTVSPFAHFGVNIGDEVDMNRLVLITLGQHFGMQKTGNQWTNLKG